MAQQQQLIVGSDTIRYNLTFGSERRRRLVIRIRPGGKVEVLLPRGYDLKQASEAVQQRAGWILHHVRRLQDAPSAAPSRYCNGEAHLFLGRSYALEVLASRSWQGVSLSLERMVVSTRSTSPAQVKKVLLTWYRAQAMQVFAKRLAVLVPHIAWLETSPPWQVKAMRRRWGSCSATGFLTLNTHLVKALPVCIDYVLLHEIAHLRELNHGPNFYALLCELMPTWKETRTVLHAQAPLILPE